MREITNVQHNNIDTKEARRFLWFVHLKRTGNDRIKNKILERNADGSRRNGKPTEQCMNDIRKTTISKDLSEEEVEDREL